MHKHLMACLIGVVAASSALGQSATTKIASQKGWLADLGSAKAAARRTGKPLMVVFRCDP